MAPTAQASQRVQAANQQALARPHEQRRPTSEGQIYQGHAEHRGRHGQAGIFPRNYPPMSRAVPNDGWH